MPKGGDSDAPALTHAPNTHTHTHTHTQLLADARLAIAEYNLAFVSHFVMCDACQHQRECNAVPAHPTEQLMSTMNHARLHGLLHPSRGADGAEAEGEGEQQDAGLSQISIQSEPMPAPRRGRHRGPDFLNRAAATTANGGGGISSTNNSASSIDLMGFRVGNSAPNLGQGLFAGFPDWLYDIPDPTPTTLTPSGGSQVEMGRSASRPTLPLSRRSSALSCSRSLLSGDSISEMELLSEAGEGPLEEESEGEPQELMLLVDGAEEQGQGKGDQLLAPDSAKCMGSPDAPLPAADAVECGGTRARPSE